MQAKIWAERVEKIKKEEIQKAIQPVELSQLQQIEQAWEEFSQQQDQEQVEASTEIARTTSWREVKIRVTKYDSEVEAGAKKKSNWGPDVIVEKLKENKVHYQCKQDKKHKRVETEFSLVIIGAGRLAVGQTEVDPKRGACRHIRLQEKGSQHAKLLGLSSSSTSSCRQDGRARKTDPKKEARRRKLHCQKR